MKGSLASAKEIRVDFVAAAVKLQLDGISCGNRRIENSMLSPSLHWLIFVG